MCRGRRTRKKVVLCPTTFRGVMPSEPGRSSPLTRRQRNARCAAVREQCALKRQRSTRAPEPPQALSPPRPIAMPPVSRAHGACLLERYLTQTKKCFINSCKKTKMHRLLSRPKRKAHSLKAPPAAARLRVCALGGDGAADGLAEGGGVSAGGGSFSSLPGTSR